MVQQASAIIITMENKIQLCNLIAHNTEGQYKVSLTTSNKSGNLQQQQISCTWAWLSVQFCNRISRYLEIQRVDTSTCIFTHMNSSKLLFH